MPPQQSKAFANFLGCCFNFGAHALSSQGLVATLVVAIGCDGYLEIFEARVHPLTIQATDAAAGTD